MRDRRMVRILLAAGFLTLLFSGAALGETLDEYFTCRFSWSPAVYTGPAGSYYRADGKAQYGSPGKARVYGEDNGWLLIGYETGSGHYRLGYIDGEKALERMYDAPEGAQVRRLCFDSETVFLTRDCGLTDDPIISKAPIDSLSSGDEAVFLATMGTSWGYIEIRKGAQWKRGFVPLDALSNAWQFAEPAPSSDTGEEPEADGTWEDAWEEPWTGGTWDDAREEPWTGDTWDDAWEEPWTGDTWDENTDEAPAESAAPEPAAAGTPTAPPFSGIWAVASQKLVTRSGPSAGYPETGIYFLQQQMVQIVARHYDGAEGVWWVKCRIEQGGEVRFLWTGVKRFYNPEWLLSLLPDE